MAKDFTQLLETAATIIAIIGIIPILGFIYFYTTEAVPGRRFRRKYVNTWKQTAIGRVLLYMMLSMVAFIGIVIYRYFHLEEVPFELIRAVMYLVLTIIFWRIFIILRRVQKYGDDRYHGPHNRRKTDKVSDGS